MGRPERAPELQIHRIHGDGAGGGDTGIQNGGCGNGAGSRPICGHKTGFVHLRNGGIGRAPAYIPVGDCPGKDGGGELRGAVDLHVQALCGQLQALKLVHRLVPFCIHLAVQIPDKQGDDWVIKQLK